MATGFRNPSHPKHKLELKNYLKPYTCNGCKERGSGPRYRCEKCDFDLHRECMFPQTSPFQHEFFPGSTFKFLRTPPKACHDHCKLQCDACRKDINGFVYHCEKDDLDLHPCCRKISKCGKYHVHVACVTEMILEEWKQRKACTKDSSNPTIALQKVKNLKAIQVRGHGPEGRGNKFKRILKVFIKTIVSIVIGDPTMVLASVFVELIAP